MDEYAATLRELSALRRRGIRPGVEPTRAALDRLGAPEEALRVVHVAGTNGKGSTAAMVASCARAADVRVGLFTSPHLERFTERIRTDGAEITRADAVALARRVRAAAPELTFFEVATVMALLHFRERGVDLAVVEAGLGGRLDSTNAVRAPVATIVTRIGLDHAELLGPDLGSIAREKAGVFKRGVPAFAVGDPAEVRDAVVAAATARGAPLSLLGRDFPPWSGPLALAGAHQRENAGLAASAARALGLSADAIARGIASASWPARLERLAPDVIVDCAHNEPAARALAAAVAEPSVFVFGCLRDKDARGMIAALRPRALGFVYLAPPSDRAVAPPDLAAIEPGEIAWSIEEALALARARGPVVVAGSAYLAGAARAMLLGEEMDPVDASDPAPVPAPASVPVTLTPAPRSSTPPPVPEPPAGIEGRDWVEVRVRCVGCGRELTLRAVPGRKDQRWACPSCHRRHDALTPP